MHYQAQKGKKISLNNNKIYISLSPLNVKVYNILFKVLECLSRYLSSIHTQPFKIFSKIIALDNFCLTFNRQINSAFLGNPLTCKNKLYVPEY